MAPRIIAVGETLWDLLPSGPLLGGAPANFACHAQALGAHVQLISRVGNDDLGRRMLQSLAAVGLSIDLVGIDPVAPTGTATVGLDGQGKPAFTIHPNVAWDYLTVDPPALAAAAAADAVYFGTLGRRSEGMRASYRQLLAAPAAAALRVCDLNLRAPWFFEAVIVESLELANVVKLSDEELPLLAEILGLKGNDQQLLAQVADRFRLRLVALTRGSQGSLLYAAGETSDQAGLPVEVVDTVGAGDAFTAAIVLGVLAGWPLDEINRRANRVAAAVCSQAGAMPPLPDDVRQLFAGTAG